MNRTLKAIDSAKWYHLETLKKFYKGTQFQEFTQTSSEGKEFTFIVFTKAWKTISFIMHPKSKRFRMVGHRAYEEVGFS